MPQTLQLVSGPYIELSVFISFCISKVTLLLHADLGSKFVSWSERVSLKLQSIQTTTVAELRNPSFSSLLYSYVLFHNWINIHFQFLTWRIRTKLHWQNIVRFIQHKPMLLTDNIKIYDIPCHQSNAKWNIGQNLSVRVSRNNFASGVFVRNCKFQGQNKFI